MTSQETDLSCSRDVAATTTGRALRVLLLLCLSVLWQPSSASAQPSNDLCENAEVISASGTYLRNNFGATGGDMTSSDLECGVFPDGSDVWFRVPGGTSPRQFVLNVVEVNATKFPPTMTVYSQCPTFPGEFQVGCGLRQAFRGDPGQDYYIRVAFDDAFQNAFRLSIEIVDITTTLPGDLCSAPLSITAGSTATGNTTGYSGNVVAGCGYLDAVDAWYQFDVGPGQAGTYVFDTFGSSMDTTLAIFSHCPGSFADGQLACDDDYRAEDPLFQEPFILQSQIGTYLGEGSYLVRVAGYNAATGAYTLHASQRTTPIPGDHCFNAQPLTTSVVHGSNSGLTGHTPYPYGCSLNDRTDIWYAFTPATTGAYKFTLEYEVVNTVTNFFGSLRIFDGCDGALLSCQAQDNSGTFPVIALAELVAGSTYPVRIAGYNGREGDFRLTVTPPAPNDLCENALAVTNASIDGTTDNSYNASQFEQDLGVYNGVWYSYVAPQSGWYAFSTSNTTFDTVVFLQNACDSGVLEWSNDVAYGTNNRSSAQTFLQAGQGCLVQVSGWGGQSGTFTLSVSRLSATAPTTPANDECENALAIVPGVPASVDARTATSESIALPVCFGANTDGGYGVWFKYVAVGNGTATFSQAGSHYTGVRVYTSGSADCSSLSSTMSLDNLTQLCGVGSAPAVFRVWHGTTYYFYVYSGFGRTKAEQPISPYVANLSFVASTGSCCVGTSCTVSTQLACQNLGAEYLGDAATCVKPSGRSSMMTAIADQSASSSSPAVTTYDVSVSGAPASVSSIDAQVHVTHLMAGDLTLSIRSPSGTEVSLAGRVFSSPPCSGFHPFYVLDGVYTFSDTAPLSYSQGVLANALPPDRTLDTGSYRAWDCPAGNVSLNSVFAGQNPNGVWTITAREYSPRPDGGVIRAARITINGGAGDACVPLCRADFNGVGGVTVQDIFDFLSAWFAGHPSADFNNVSGVTVQDIFDFLATYFAGC